MVARARCLLWARPCHPDTAASAARPVACPRPKADIVRASAVAPSGRAAAAPKLQMRPHPAVGRGGSGATGGAQVRRVCCLRAGWQVNRCLQNQNEGGSAADRRSNASWYEPAIEHSILIPWLPELDKTRFGKFWRRRSKIRQRAVFAVVRVPQYPQYANRSILAPHPHGCAAETPHAQTVAQSARDAARRHNRATPQG